MKRILLSVAGGFFLGAGCIYSLIQYAMADEITLARLYPSTVALRVTHDVRVLSAIQANDVPQATRLLKLDIDVGVNTLLGLGKAGKLDEDCLNAVLIGQEALSRRAPVVP